MTMTIIPSDAVHRPIARSHRPRRARPRDEHHDDRSRRFSPSDSPSRSFVALSRPLVRARARATVGALASTKSRDGDTSTGHDSSLSAILVPPSSIPPLSVDCIASKSPVVTRHAVPIDSIDSTRLDSIDSTRPIDRTSPIDASTSSSAPRGPGERARRSVRAFVASVVRRVASRRSSRRSSVVASSRRRVVGRRVVDVPRSVGRSFARRRDGTGRDGTGLEDDDG